MCRPETRATGVLFVAGERRGESTAGTWAQMLSDDALTWHASTGSPRNELWSPESKVNPCEATYEYG